MGGERRRRWKAMQGERRRRWKVAEASHLGELEEGHLWRHRPAEEQAEERVVADGNDLLELPEDRLPTRGLIRWTSQSGEHVASKDQGAELLERVASSGLEPRRVCALVCRW